MTVIRRWPLLSGIVCGLVAVVLFGVLTWALVGRERQCPAGQAPATNPTMGSDCFPGDEPLPEGYRLDPGGNKVYQG